MVEIIYNDPGQKDGFVLVKPPKNIRQMGNPAGRHKIYIEDYVHTFLHSPIFSRGSHQRIAVLIGKSEVSMDIRYTFVSGAVDCDQYALQGESIVFDEACWEILFKEIKVSFDGLEVVGWFLSLSDTFDTVPAPIESVHRQFFTGRDKILFLFDEVEKEDGLYTYEQGSLHRKEGYYIYYEKNLAMQEYMVAVREGGGQTTDLPSDAEIALQGYRGMLLEKSAGKNRGRRRAAFYTAASAAMIALCVLGITAINNYEKMREVESVLSTLTQGPAQDVPANVIIDSIPADLLQPQLPEPPAPEPAVPELPTPEPPAPEPSVQEATPPEPPAPEPSVQEATPPEPPPVSEAAPEEGKQEFELPVEDQGALLARTEQAPPSEAAVPTAAQAYLEQGYYIVQPGDKLEQISMEIYNTTAMIDKITARNHILNIDKIYVGQKILLP